MKKALTRCSACLFIYLSGGDYLVGQATNKIDSIGNVGVGTTNPGTKLEVSGGFITFRDESGSGSTTAKGFIQQNRDQAYFGSLDANSRVSLYAGGGQRLTVLSNGNVGIGTTTPSFSIDVNKPGASINLNGTGFGNSSASVNLLGWASAYKNWKITTASFSSGLDFVPSTTTGGSTFTTPVMTILNGGNVGIGTTTPTYAMDISKPGATINLNGTGFGNSGASVNLLGWASSYKNWQISTANFSSGLDFVPSTTTGGSTFTTPVMTILNEGNVGIGTASPSEKLSVNGNVSAKKVIVTQLGWSDYVFNDDYKLRSLSSLENFIKQNRHLPDMPSAKEVEMKGISVGDNQALLLKKIEELTLYLLEMEKKNKNQQKQIDDLNINIQQLNKKIDRK